MKNALSFGTALILCTVGCDLSAEDPLWYSTCGDPACGGYSADAHSNAECTSEAEGDPCEAEGEGCDLVDDCNTELICATEDPKDGDYGCPVSLRAAKTDIHYLGAADARALHEELMAVRLADYRYRTDAGGTPTHLGFIIDDQRSTSPMVRPSGERVDLYGYTSMAVAALQVQEARIQAQEARITQLTEQLERLEARLEEDGGNGR